MKTKYYLISGIIILSLLVFLSLREYQGNYYEISIENTHAILTNTDLNISAGELNTAGSDILKLNVVRGNAEKEMFSEEENQLTVPTTNLLDRKLLKRLENNNGTIVIVSEDLDLVAQAWVILTRKGIDNIKILGIRDNEMLRFAFEPSTN